MIQNAKVPLHRLVLSLSDALDCVHPEIADHHQRVTYIALNIARRMGFAKGELRELFLAAALHDIGQVHLASDSRDEAGHLHGEAGYELLRNSRIFARPAEIIRHHHVSWQHGRGEQRDSRPVPLGAHILYLADSIERAVDRRVPILQQSEHVARRVARLAGQQFRPDCVQAFRDVAAAEAFWLDCASKRVYSLLLEIVEGPTLTLTDGLVQDIAEIFGHIVDGMSRWTATHSNGVAAAAVELAALLGFSPRECACMRTAGLLHDLGKLSVPTSVLDKPGELTAEEWALVRGHSYQTYRILETIGDLPQLIEWAAFHHERLDGSGYPFHHTAQDLTLGSRVMAVADTFTAMTEDRPYRPGLPNGKVTELLERMAGQGHLDGSVVSLLVDNYEAIDTARRQEQARYAESQRQMAATLDGLAQSVAV